MFLFTFLVTNRGLDIAEFYLKVSFQIKLFVNFILCCIFVKFSQKKVDVSTKVYVGGIPYYSTKDDIRSFFEGCGSITEIDCMKFPDSRKFRGIAIISFKVCV